MFGTNEEFEELCSEAEALGIKIILDGVFSHTGSDSRYFNMYNNYKEIYEKHGNKKTIFGGYKKHENEILMFLHAKEKLENLGINTNVSIDKLKEKIIEQKEEISLLGNEFKNIEKRLESIRKANSKIENIIQEKIDLTKEKEKER